MKLSANWIRDYVDLSVEDRQLAQDLTDVGLGVEGIEGHGADTVFEMEIGTNRPDAMNHYGVAREAAAIYDLPLKQLAPSLPSAAEAASGAASDAALKGRSSTAVKGSASMALKDSSSTALKDSSSMALKGRSSTALKDSASMALKDSTSTALKGSSSMALKGSSSTAPGAAFSITVEEPNLCPRFTARVIRNTRILPSLEKIARRLQLLDQRPISNAVDATNYVLWEIGKPTHVFDADLLEGGRIVVRKAREGEVLKTLDGVVRKLTTEDLVVCDANKPVGLAGVMGGYDTMITERTRNIVIESAWWDPLIVRKMSRRHMLHTDASHRFERGADFESTILSCDLVAKMIVESGGGELHGDVVDVISKKMDQAPVLLHVSEVHRILGGSLDAGQVFRLLKRLGFTLIPEGQGENQFWVHIPSWRLDVEREIDLIEEVARLHGYDKFANTLPSYSGAVVEPPQAAMDTAVRERALALGYNEALSLTFVSHADAERFSCLAPDAKVLELENPLSEEASLMRTSLVPGMLDMLAWNLNRDVSAARLFEVGSIYLSRNGQREEPKRAILGTTEEALQSTLPLGGALDVSKGERAKAAETFRALKGDVEALLSSFEGEVRYDRESAEYFHPERSARVIVNGAPVARFGQIHPEVAAARKLRQDVFVAEFDLDVLYALGLRKVKFQPLAKFPAVERDFSFVFADSVLFEQMKKAAHSLDLADLRDFRPVEIFRGGSIEAGKYSILLRARFQPFDRTLRDDEIAERSARIVTALKGLGGVQRA